MRRILFLLLVVGLTASTTAMAGMSTSKVRKETRFLTDKMAYELNLSTQQYNDAYEINYDFIYSVRNIMDYVARGYEWALDDYYEALDIRNDDLRWVLSEVQYRRFLGAEYFYRPIYVTGGKWSFRVYINYPNRNLFYFGIPYHYRTYSGAHYRPYFHHVSFYRDRYNFRHYSTPYRVREQRTFHSYRRSDFGSVHFRPNSSVRPHNAPTRPGVSQRPNNTSRPGTSTRPNTSQRPGSSSRPETSKPGTSKPGTSRPETSTRPRPGSGNSNKTEEHRPNRRPETNSNSSGANRRPTGSATNTTRPNRESGHTNNSSGTSTNRRPESSSNRNSNRNSSSSTRGNSSSSSRNTNSSSSRSNASSRQTEKRSSSESTRSNSSRNSSRSSERNNNSRK